MQRILGILAIVSLALSAAGCRMCANPYDYCGPVATGGECPQCASTARAGSTFLGEEAFVYETQEEPAEMVPTPDYRMAGRQP